MVTCALFKTMIRSIKLQKILEKKFLQNFFKYYVKTSFLLYKENNKCDISNFSFFT